jgi:hypothetical protein
MLMPCFCQYYCSGPDSEPGTMAWSLVKVLVRSFCIDATVRKGRFLTAA